VNRQQIDTGFEAVRLRRQIAARIDDLRSEAIRLHEVRALPARAGSALARSSHLIQWGSRWAAGPRIAVSVYLQRGDVAPWHHAIIDLTSAIAFEHWLAWIDESAGSSELFPRTTSR
jgi:hypothetical protein